jgi:adenylosuccinate lyase
MDHLDRTESFAGAVDDEPCKHERGHIGDNRFHGGGYARPVTRQIFCDVCRLRRWCDIEAALALSQAELGIIPSAAAAKIEETLRVVTLDYDEIVRGISLTGHSLVPLLRVLEKECGGFAGEFLHHGATTQDIQDTGLALEMREVFDLISHHVDHLLIALAQLAKEHRDHLITGRTHAQPALPTTFGLKVAGWADELMRHRTRLQEARPRILVAQLAGGVGTLAGFGDKARLLQERFAARLGLGVPMVGWHVSRDRIAEYVHLLAMMTSSLARIADEIRTLSRPEFQELEERWGSEQVGSSTMPHKRNPENCEQVVVLARLARAQVPVALEAMIVEHERDYRATRLEWPIVMDSSHYTLTAFSLMATILSGLRVHAERMAQTATYHSDSLCTEAMMLTLGSFVGKQRAFELVRRLFSDAIERRAPIGQVYRQSPEITALMDDAAIERLLEPRSHLGMAGEIVDSVVKAISETVPRERASRPSSEFDAVLFSQARESPRYEFILRVDSSQQRSASYLTEIGRGGCRLKTSLPMVVGNQLGLTLSFPGLLSPLPLRGEVRWVEKHDEKNHTAGIAFRHLTGEDRARIDALLAALSALWGSMSIRFRSIVLSADPVLRGLYEREARNFAELNRVKEMDVVTVADAQAFWAAIKKEPVDLAIIDVDGLPRIGELCDEISKITPSIVVLSTGDTPPQARTLERCTYLTKPVHFGVLLQTISTLLAVADVPALAPAGLVRRAEP